MVGEAGGAAWPARATGGAHVNQSTTKSTVTVTIAGEEYTIRAEAAPEYMRRCAALVDQTVSQVMRQGALVEAHKAAILAALSLSDQLFQARAEAEALRREIARLAARLTADIEASVPAGDLASPREDALGSPPGATEPGRASAEDG
nr:MAG: hypothetical protein DIU52_11415 [bacterium]